MKSLRFVLIMAIANVTSACNQSTTQQEASSKAKPSVDSLEAGIDTISKEKVLKQENTIVVASWADTLNYENPKYLFKLDSAANKSDASFSEEIGAKAARFYNKNPTKLMEYLALHPNSRLEELFTDELSAQLSVYVDLERKNEYNDLIKRLTTEIARTNVDSIGKSYLRLKMLKRIDPSKYD